MKRFLLFFAVFAFGFHFSYAQRTCGSVLNLDRIEKQDPTRYQRILQIEEHLEQYNEMLGNKISLGTPAIIRIPVVVHVLHNGESVGTGLNISMAQIESQIDVLNEDFRRLNADATNTPSGFQSVAADPGIEFYLACIDPDGNPSSGVVRKQGQSSYTVVQQSPDKVNESATGIKLGASGSVAWPSDQYLNLWVCNLSGSLLGYAQFPHYYTTDPNTDGVVITTTAFGRTGNVIAPFDLGRTATHEVGHWLNLRHIWGDEVGCGGIGDDVADTPDQNNARTDCPSFPQTSCSSNDMFMNYMDYTNDACMNIYTLGQRARMRALFSPGGTRRSFIENPMGMSLTGPDDFCTSDTYTLSNLPTSATVAWSANPSGVTISGSGSTITVTRAGTFNGKVTLTATVTSSCGTYDISKEVQVGTPTPEITNVYVYPEYNQIDVLINTVPGATSYEYYIDGVLDGSTLGSSHVYSFYGVPCGYTYHLSVKAIGPCGPSWEDVDFAYLPCVSPFTVSPNPANGSLTVTAEGENAAAKSAGNQPASEFNVKLYNGQGRLLREADSENGSVTLDTQDLPEGTHYLHISGGKETVKRQVVIKH